MHNLRNITLAEENKIRFDCRTQYREEGSLHNPYEPKTIERLIWGSEASRIYLESMESGLNEHH